MTHPHLDAFIAPEDFVLVGSREDGVTVYAAADSGSDVDAGALQPDEVVTASLDPSAAQAIAARWIGGGWMRPSGLAASLEDDGMVESVRWVWRCSAAATVHWRSPDEEGTLELEETVESPAELPVICRQSGMARGEQLLWDQFVAVARTRIPATACLNVQMTQPDCFLIHHPVFEHRFDWAGRPWTVQVDGVSGAVVGPRPVAWMRVRAAMVACFLPGLALGLCVGLPTLVIAGFGILVWGGALGMLALGTGCALWIHGRALSQEAG